MANCMSSICRAFRAGVPEGTERLRCILTEIMISHTKEDVKIPPPIRITQKLDMSLQESIAYDSIASYVRANILLTRWGIIIPFRLSLVALPSWRLSERNILSRSLYLTRDGGRSHVHLTYNV